MKRLRMRRWKGILIITQGQAFPPVPANTMDDGWKYLQRVDLVLRNELDATFGEDPCNCVFIHLVGGQTDDQ